MSDQKVIVVGSCRTGMSQITLYGPAYLIEVIKNHPEIKRRYELDNSAARGKSEIEQLLKQISDDGSKNLKQLITGDEFKSLLPKDPKPVRKQEPYYRRFEKRKF